MGINAREYPLQSTLHHGKIVSMKQPNDGIQRPFHVIDTRDGRILRRCVSYAGANRLAERFNQEYGAVRYGVALPPVQVERDIQNVLERERKQTTWEISNDLN